MKLDDTVIARYICKVLCTIVKNNPVYSYVNMFLNCRSMNERMLFFFLTEPGSEFFFKSGPGTEFISRIQIDFVLDPDPNKISGFRLNLVIYN